MSGEGRNNRGDGEEKQKTFITWLITYGCKDKYDLVFRIFSIYSVISPFILFYFSATSGDSFLFFEFPINSYLEFILFSAFIIHGLIFLLILTIILEIHEMYSEFKGEIIDEK